MNKKIALGCCVCIVLIVIVIILFFKPTSEYNLADISDNLYNIFQTRKKSAPWNIEYQSIDSLFEPRFVNEIKTTIKDRIKVNIPRYIEWDLRTVGGALNIYLSMYIGEIEDGWSSKNIIEKIPKPIKEDERFKVCNSLGAECIHRTGGGEDWDDESYMELWSSDADFFTFTKSRQLQNFA